MEEPKQLVQLEQAKSARSTCKITSEKIDKGMRCDVCRVSLAQSDEGLLTF